MLILFSKKHTQSLYATRTIYGVSKFLHLHLVLFWRYLYFRKYGFSYRNGGTAERQKGGMAEGQNGRRAEGQKG